MFRSLRFLLALGLLTTATTYCQAQVNSDLPEEIERQIDEQTEKLPEEVREKVRDALKRKAAEKFAEIKEAKEAAEASASESDEQDDEDEGESSDDKAEDDKKDSEDKKPATPPASDEAKKLKAEMDLYDAKFKHKVFEYKKQLEAQLLMLEKTKLDRRIEAERVAESKAALTRERDRLKLEFDIEKLRREFEKQALEAELAKLSAEKARIEAQMSVESAKESLEDRVLGEEQYPDEPFKDGVLSISPRRIELNGPIMTGAADYVCQRLDYFNNQSSKPIFIVIDNCPGGSVMEGFQIVQRMRESDAPVHVVVKRFAASMAACITTLADHSYCYPNSIILHHQASSRLVGNGRSMEDQKKMFDEISTRLLGSVAKKIGTTEEEFVNAMYENRSSGDWDVFGDKAVEMKWVGAVVNEVCEESIRKRPSGMRSSPMRIFGLSGDGQRTGVEPTGANYLERYETPLVEETDAKGRPFVRLPRISPIDAWLIYNPDGYYR
ncbi:MAG: ATP-dependent Clp protease proteolytic subunit [Planctomycetota bacterium]